MNKCPSPEVLSALNTLCSDPNNTVFVVSGRGKESLAEWLGSCRLLGIAVEHGYFLRWSTIEAKECSIVWHHQDADPDFGSWQAMKLMDHLESVLTNQPAVVSRGQDIVEAKSQGVSKGLVVEKVMSTVINAGKQHDFLMCIGDDRSDEDMFESLLKSSSSSSLPLTPEVFCCTVGQKPSKAKYYLNDTANVLKLLSCLATAASTQKPQYNPHSHVSFESYI